MTDRALQADFGGLLRDWRKRRRLSQLDLAAETNLSSRHLSFLETGRSRPSRQTLLRLAEQLDLPLRARNQMLHAAGFAPAYAEHALAAPEMAAARGAVEAVLAGHAPFPALAIDRHWTLVASNDAVPPLLAGVSPTLLAPPVNVLRLSLHPEGLAPRIVNLGEWRAHLLARLRLQIENGGDPLLVALREELLGYPFRASPVPVAPPGMAVPLLLATSLAPKPLALLSTTTVFGMPNDVTLSELALECFFPADAETRAALVAAR